MPLMPPEQGLVSQKLAAADYERWLDIKAGGSHE
jgi:hypothetical protein